MLNDKKTEVILFLDFLSVDAAMLEYNGKELDKYPAKAILYKNE